MNTKAKKPEKPSASAVRRAKVEKLNQDRIIHLVNERAELIAQRDAALAEADVKRHETFAVLRRCSNATRTLKLVRYLHENPTNNVAGHLVKLDPKAYEQVCFAIAELEGKVESL